MRRIRLLVREFLVFIALFVAMANGFVHGSSAMTRKLRARITHEACVSKRTHANTQKKRNNPTDMNADDLKTVNANTDANESGKCIKKVDNKCMNKGRCQRGCRGCPFNALNRDLLAFPYFKDCE